MKATSFSGLLGLVFAFALSACEPLDETSDVIIIDQCQQSAGNKPVGGTWNLSGNGTRGGCANDHFDTDDMRVEIRGLQLTQKPGTGADAIDSLELAPLSLPENVSVTLSGTSVRGSCVGFTLNENDQRPGGPGLVTYNFYATVGADGTLTGTFDFTGPANCDGSGRFVANKIQ